MVTSRESHADDKTPGRSPDRQISLTLDTTQLFPPVYILWAKIISKFMFNGEESEWYQSFHLYLC